MTMRTGRTGYATDCAQALAAVHIAMADKRNPDSFLGRFMASLLSVLLCSAAT
jgi:hypothetical protein